LLLCASRKSFENLRSEGLSRRAQIVGDVMYDVACFAQARISPTRSSAQFGLDQGQYILLTLHRAENTRDGQRIATLLDFVRRQAAGRVIVFPVHPRTEAALRAFGSSVEGVRLLPPQTYIEFQGLLSGAAEIMTDSGGVQKEAYFQRIPCTTLRDETEWTETVDAGWNRLWNHPIYNTPRREISDYGDGRAAEASIAAIAGLLGA